MKIPSSSACMTAFFLSSVVFYLSFSVTLIFIGAA